MIRKQEGGTERGRLLVPGEPRDWAARSLIPLPPSSPALYGSSVPAESPFSPGPEREAPRGPARAPGGGDNTIYGGQAALQAPPPARDWSALGVASLFF